MKHDNTIAKQVFNCYCFYDVKNNEKIAFYALFTNLSNAFCLFVSSFSVINSSRRLATLVLSCMYFVSSEMNFSSEDFK